jgi:hypothetical protein
MFLIAGIQPKTRIVDATPRRCPQCGLYQARLQRIDHYFSLFFIPLLPVKRGNSFLYCERCQGPSGETTQQVEPGSKKNCQTCGHRLASGFRFCPGCGRPVA